MLLRASVVQNGTLVPISTSLLIKSRISLRQHSSACRRRRGRSRSAAGNMQHGDSGPVETIFVDELVVMGFSKNAALRACLATHSCGIEPALDWISTHAEDTDLNEPLPRQTALGVLAAAADESGEGSSGAVLGVPSDASLVEHPDLSHAPATVVGVDGECKVVLLVLASLGMSAGKIGAQCAHAAVGMYKQLVQQRVPWLRCWEDGGEKTVVLAVSSLSEMEKLWLGAQASGLLTHQVYDAGRTEVAANSLTVVAIGGRSQQVDNVTGWLRTL